jgi:hypothetical protein
MVVLNQGESGNQLKERLRTLSKCIEDVLPEIPVKEITNKRGMIRKTAHSYKKQFEGDYGQVRDYLVLESTWLGYHEPYTQVDVSSYIYQMMVGAKQETLAKEYNLLPFQVNVLEPVRTICEKIMSLVRFSHTSQPIVDLKLKIRHLYDIHQLLNLDELSLFLDSDEFETMLLKVAQDDVEGYRSGNEWLAIHPKEAILFKEANQTWNEIKVIYKSSFTDLVYGKLPAENDILETILRISKRLQSIEWNVNLARN